MNNFILDVIANESNVFDQNLDALYPSTVLYQSSDSTFNEVTYDIFNSQLSEDSMDDLHYSPTSIFTTHIIPDAEMPTNASVVECIDV